MKELKFVKYQIFDTIKAIFIYYLIFILAMTSIIAISSNSSANVHSSGIDFATIIFLFVAGLNSFKSNFKFSMANNVTRKTFTKGLIIAVFPITLVMSVIDLIVNRIINIFMKCPSTFDMIYGSFRKLNLFNNSELWVQTNDFYTLFGTIIWQFAVYSSIFILGILISLLYYRSNKFFKIVVSVAPVLLLIFISNANVVIVDSLNIDIGKLIASAFGWNSLNPYTAVLSFTVIILAYSSLIYLLVRKAIIKE